MKVTTMRPRVSYISVIYFAFSRYCFALQFFPPFACLANSIIEFFIAPIYKPTADFPPSENQLSAILLDKGPEILMASGEFSQRASSALTISTPQCLLAPLLRGRIPPLELNVPRNH